jgi:hypothetical protein
MNPYTSRTQARIQPHDMTRALFTDPFTAASALAALERTRAYQAEAEMDRLLKQHSVRPRSAGSVVATMRQTLGAALIRAGQRFSGTAATCTPPAPAPVSGRLRMAD